MEKWFKKVAVITGASTLIGQQLAADLSKHGLNVIGLTRKKHVIDSLAKKHNTNPGKIFAIECDISKPEIIKSAFKQIETKFGCVHVIVNNAGKIQKGETLDAKNLADEEIISTINFSLTGVILCTREAFKLMQKSNEHGYIININSLVGGTLFADKKGYSNVFLAAKYAVKNHTETVRLDLASANNKLIKVTSLNPGCVKSAINPEIWDTVPKLDPEEVSSIILYLLSTPPEVNITELTVKATGFPL